MAARSVLSSVCDSEDSVVTMLRAFVEEASLSIMMRGFGVERPEDELGTKQKICGFPNRSLVKRYLKGIYTTAEHNYSKKGLPEHSALRAYSLTDM